jgi:hypothetical protein
MAAVAFLTHKGPNHAAPTQAGHCGFWEWKTELYPTNSSRSPAKLARVGGYIVQKVTLRLTEVTCGHPDDWRRGVIWEYWDLSRPGPHMDSKWQRFLTGHDTQVRVVLEAGHMRRIDAGLLQPTPGNPDGAHGKLAGRPRGFRPSLERSVAHDATCCDGRVVYSHFVTAQNRWATYMEQWVEDPSNEEGPREHYKAVNDVESTNERWVAGG